MHSGRRTAFGYDARSVLEAHTRRPALRKPSTKRLAFTLPDEEVAEVEAQLGREARHVFQQRLGRPPRVFACRRDGRRPLPAASCPPRWRNRHRGRVSPGRRPQSGRRRSMPPASRSGTTAGSAGSAGSPGPRSPRRAQARRIARVGCKPHGKVCRAGVQRQRPLEFCLGFGQPAHASPAPRRGQRAPQRRSGRASPPCARRPQCAAGPRQSPRSPSQGWCRPRRASRRLWHSRGPPRWRGSRAGSPLRSAPWCTVCLASRASTMRS